MLGRTGTSGEPDSDLPCTNNVDKFFEAVGGLPPFDSDDDDDNGSCAKEGEECDHPTWAVQKCCETGTRCELWQSTQYGRCSRQNAADNSPSPSPPPPPPPPPLPPPSQCQGTVVNEGEECDHPDWTNPQCCSQGLTCQYYQDTRYARCRSSAVLIPHSSCQGEAVQGGEECDHPEWSESKCCDQGLVCQYWQDTRYARCQ